MRPYVHHRMTIETAEWSPVDVITVDLSKGLLTVDQSEIQTGHM